MIDPVGMSIQAVGVRSAAAPALIFAAGALSSVGPCAAPRMIALAGILANQTRSRAAITLASFVAGLVAAYASFGAVASLIGHLVRFSSVVYWMVAAALLLGGVTVLAWERDRRCGNHSDKTTIRPPGGAFLLGGSFALVVSPCCTPIVTAILAYTSASGDPVYGSALLSCFAAGHALPLFALGLGYAGLRRFVERLCLEQATAVISGALMLCLALYYMVLA